MSANTSPVFGRTSDVQLAGAVLGPNAQTGTVPSQGIDANTVSIYQADPIEGSFVSHVRLKPVGAPAATVIRLYLCNVTGAFTAGTSNTLVTTSLITEFGTSAVIASAIAPNSELTIPINYPIPAGYRLLMGFGTSTGAAGTGYQVTTFAMKY